MRAAALLAALAALAACGDGRPPGGPGGRIDPEAIHAALQTCIDGDPDAGIATLDTALARVPGATDALVTRGLCHWTRADATGDPADARRAVDDLGAAIDGYDGDPHRPTTPLAQIYSHRAFAARLLHPDDWRPTLRDLDRAVEIAPRAPLHALDRGVVHRAAGDTAAARSDLRRFLALADSSDVERRQLVERMIDELEPLPDGP